MGTVRRKDQGLGTTANGGSSGSFAPHERETSAPPAVTSIDEEGLHFTAAELGLENTRAYFVRVDQDPSDGRITVSASLLFDPVTEGALTERQFDRGYLHIDQVLQKRYGAESMENTDGTSLSFDVCTSLDFAEEATERGVGEKVWNDTKLVQFTNESDPGTYGCEYPWAQVATDIDNGFFPRAGVGESELSIRDTAKEAMHMRQAGMFPQLSMLSERGYCVDALTAQAELLSAHQAFGKSRETVELAKLLDAEVQDQDERRSKVIHRVIPNLSTS